MFKLKKKSNNDLSNVQKHLQSHTVLSFKAFGAFVLQ